MKYRLWYNMVMINRVFGLLSLLATVILLTMITMTTPSGIGPVGVLLFFTMIYVALYGPVLLLVKIFLQLLGRRKLKQKDYYYTAILTFGPILVILLQSFGSLSVLSIIGVFIVLSTSCFIVEKSF